MNLRYVRWEPCTSVAKKIRMRFSADPPFLLKSPMRQLPPPQSISLYHLTLSPTLARSFQRVPFG